MPPKKKRPARKPGRTTKKVASRKRPSRARASKPAPKRTARKSTARTRVRKLTTAVTKTARASVAVMKQKAQAGLEVAREKLEDVKAAAAKTLHAAQSSMTVAAEEFKTQMST